MNVPEVTETPPEPVSGARWALGERLPEWLVPWEYATRAATTPDSVFEAKYRNFTYRELGYAKLERYRELVDTYRRLLDERLESGEVVLREMDMEVDGDFDGVPDAEPGFALEVKGHHPYVQARTYKDVEGPGEVKVAWLPFDEYPDLYELKDEVAWLQLALNQLEDE